MIPKIIKTPPAKAARVSIDFVKYFVVFVAALALPVVSFGAGLIGKFTALVPMLALLLVVGSYGKSVLFQLRFHPITDLSPVLSSDVVSIS